MFLGIHFYSDIRTDNIFVCYIFYTEREFWDYFSYISYFQYVFSVRLYGPSMSIYFGNRF